MTGSSVYVWLSACTQSSSLTVRWHQLKEHASSLSVIFRIACQELLMLPKTCGKRSFVHVYIQGRMKAWPWPNCHSVLQSLSQNNAALTQADSWWLLTSWVRLFPVVVLRCICLPSMTFRYVRNHVWDKNEHPGNDGSKVSCSKPALASGFQKLAQAQKLCISFVKSLSVRVLCLFPSK